ncbi:U32 family peptidase [Clostridium sp. 19966]|uniref:peptidase U32 family protein n=1 Tax=Clostridium sp. 19966 TaxID=2768166 RepID=UPI0028DFF919|nr:U32 family peptidase [Clostridium sp. 19966]MDT8718484.1 U32 family peptidase [Clostridium sp. 19966]
MKKPELLAPAGNLEKLKAAIEFGADAVYLGGSRLNLRAFADNFTTEQLREGIEFAHSRGKKVYVTVNIFPHNEELIGLEEYLKELSDIGADAIIVSDAGIIMTAKEAVPELEIHLSTQANCTNYKAALFWHRLGVKRVVMARELSFREYRELRKRLPESCEIEAFVHGAMCMAYSGKCLLSNFLMGRDANRGKCAQICRYKFHLAEERAPGEYHDITKDTDGTFLMNSKDLCMIEHIPELMNSRIDSFKIEGRIKSPFYVASVVKAYRQAMDSYAENPEDYSFNPKWMDYLQKSNHRPYTTGFYFNENVKQHYGSSAYIRNYDIVGIVRAYDSVSHIATIEQKNKVYNEDHVEVLSPQGEDKIIKLLNMRNKAGKPIESAPSAQMIFTVQCDEELEPGDMLIKAIQ